MQASFWQVALYHHHHHHLHLYIFCFSSATLKIQRDSLKIHIFFCILLQAHMKNSGWQQFSVFSLALTQQAHKLMT